MTEKETEGDDIMKVMQLVERSNPQGTLYSLASALSVEFDFPPDLGIPEGGEIVAVCDEIKRKGEEGTWLKAMPGGAVSFVAPKGNVAALPSPLLARACREWPSLLAAVLGAIGFNLIESSLRGNDGYDLEASWAEVLRTYLLKAMRRHIETGLMGDFALLPEDMLEEGQVQVIEVSPVLPVEALSSLWVDVLGVMAG